MYKIIRSLYLAGKITSVEVWGYVDDGRITANQATLICGPRPITGGEVQR